MCEYCGMSRCPSGCPNHETEMVCRCSQCDGEIYAGDEIYKIGDEVWCESCVADCRTYAEGDD